MATRTGIGTASPNTMHSRLRRDEMPLTTPCAQSGTALLMKSWSRSVVSRRTNSEPHCDSTASDRSDGRCEISPSEMPCLRPSLAMRSKLRCAADFTLPSSRGR